MTSKDLPHRWRRKLASRAAPWRINATRVISVIIPAYNVVDFVREAVDSALAQTFRDIEVIVVDDGSTDGSADALRDLDDPRLRVVREGHAGSAAAATPACAWLRVNWWPFWTATIAGRPGISKSSPRISPAIRKWT